MVLPQVADGWEAFQIWRITASIVNKQLLSADKGWTSSLGVGHRANNTSQWKLSIAGNVTQGFRIGISDRLL
jgi:hypothetical protein